MSEIFVYFCQGHIFFLKTKISDIFRRNSWQSELFSEKDLKSRLYKYSTCVFLTMGLERFIAFTKILNADITLYSSLVTFGNSNAHIKISGQGFDFFNLVILITSTKKFGLVDGIQTMGRVHSMKHFFPIHIFIILWMDLESTISYFHLIHIFFLVWFHVKAFFLYFQWLNEN